MWSTNAAAVAGCSCEDAAKNLRGEIDEQHCLKQQVNAGLRARPSPVASCTPDHGNWPDELEATRE